MSLIEFTGFPLTSRFKTYLFKAIFDAIDKKTQKWLKRKWKNSLNNYISNATIRNNKSELECGL